MNVLFETCRLNLAHSMHWYFRFIRDIVEHKCNVCEILCAAHYNDCFDTFRIAGTSFDLTRMSLLPKQTALPVEGDESLRVVCAVTASIHEFVFSYNCLRNARETLEESFPTAVAAFTGATNLREHLRPTSTSMVPLRSWMRTNIPSNSSFSRPTGAGLLEELTPSQKSAIQQMVTKPIALLDCLAGAGKTKALMELLRCKISQLTTKVNDLGGSPEQADGAQIV